MKHLGFRRVASLSSGSYPCKRQLLASQVCDAISLRVLSVNIIHASGARVWSWARSASHIANDIN